MRYSPSQTDVCFVLFFSFPDPPSSPQRYYHCPHECCWWKCERPDNHTCSLTWEFDFCWFPLFPPNFSLLPPSYTETPEVLMNPFSKAKQSIPFSIETGLCLPENFFKNDSLVLPSNRPFFPWSCPHFHELLRPVTSRSSNRAGVFAAATYKTVIQVSLSFSFETNPLPFNPPLPLPLWFDFTWRPSSTGP